MTVTMSIETQNTPIATTHRGYLDLHLHRLRLRLLRRAMWLRRQWRGDRLQPSGGLVISEAAADRMFQGEDRGDELGFYFDDAEAASVSGELAQLEERIRNDDSVFLASSSPPGLLLLSTIMQLSSFERDVVLLCLAPMTDPSFGRLLAYVQDDVNATLATPHLANVLFTSPSRRSDNGVADPQSKYLDAFRPSATLRRFRLIEIAADVDSLSATTPLHVDERIRNYVLGHNEPDRRVLPWLSYMEPGPVPDGLQETVDGLARAIRSEPCAIINLVGTDDGLHERMVASLCRSLGTQCFRLNIAGLVANVADTHPWIRLLERETILMPTFLYTCINQPIGDPPHAERDASVAALLEQLPAGLIVGSERRISGRRHTLVCHVPKLTADAQRELWRAALGAATSDMGRRIDEIVSQFDLDWSAIEGAAASAHDRARMRSSDDPVVTEDDLWEACRRQIVWSLDDSAQRISPCYAWSDIVLPNDTEGQLREIIAQVRHRPRVYEQWGFGRKLARGRGVSALFAGASGTGKTMAAEIIARELAVDLYRVDLAGVVSKFIGDTEKRLRGVFDAAESCGAMLFFDEADALFGKRSEVKDSHDRYANIEINYLLQRMEDYSGLVILATNRRASLDRAFLRRLRFLVDFPFPNKADRSRIWRSVFPDETELAALDWNALSQLELTGGHIRNIALRAAFLAADESKPIDMDHVMRSAQREYAKIGKMATQDEFGKHIQKGGG